MKGAHCFRGRLVRDTLSLNAQPLSQLVSAGRTALESSAVMRG